MHMYMYIYMYMYMYMYMHMHMYMPGIHCAWYVLSYILLRCGETYVLARLSGGLLCAAIGLSWRCVVE